MSDQYSRNETEPDLICMKLQLHAFIRKKRKNGGTLIIEDKFYS